jgi:hypothetical protein
MSRFIVKLVLAFLGILLFEMADAQNDRECEKIDITYLQVGPVRLGKEGEIRQTLWTAFNEGIPKCLIVTWFTKEGDPNIYRYEIQSDSEKHATISIEITREFRSRGLPSAPKRVIRENYMATTLKLIPLASPGADKTIRPSDPKVFKRHKLQLLDARGILIQEI